MIKYLLSIFFLIPFCINAQSVKLGLGAGINFIQTADGYHFNNGQTAGSLSELITVDNLGLKGEPNISLAAKLSLPIFSVNGEFKYLFLKGMQDDVNYINDPLSSNAFARGNYEMEQDIWALSLGGQYDLIPGPVAPFIAMDLVYTSFGKTKISLKNVSEAFNNDLEGYERYGLALGAGVDIGILPVFDVSVSAKYYFYNLFNKKDGEERFNAINLNVILYYSVL